MVRVAGRQDRHAQSLYGSGDDQPCLVLSQSAEEARNREDSEAEQEDLAPAEEVGGPTTQQEEPSEGQRVHVDDPLQSRGGEVEVLLDGRQGYIDDRGVQYDHELSDQDDAEDEPGRDHSTGCDLDGVVGVFGATRLPFRCRSELNSPLPLPTLVGGALFPPAGGTAGRPPV